MRDGNSLPLTGRCASCAWYHAVKAVGRVRGDRGVNSCCPWLHTRSLSDGSAQGCFHKLLQACGVCFHTGVQDKFRRIVLGSLARAAAQFTPCPGTGQIAHKKTGRRFQGKFDMAYGEVLLRKKQTPEPSGLFCRVHPTAQYAPQDDRWRSASREPPRLRLNGEHEDWPLDKEGGSPRVKGTPAPCGNRNRAGATRYSAPHGCL